jgi:hypothetical protein
MSVQWLGQTLRRPALRSPSFRAPSFRAPVLTTLASTYQFQLVRITVDCRELVAWSDGPQQLTATQASTRFADIASRVTGTGAYPGEGLELRMLLNNRVAQKRVFTQRPAACAPVSGTIGWLGQSGCTFPPCEQGHSRVFDTSCPAGRVRCRPSAFEPCPSGEASYGQAGCVPITCPAGTVRDLSTFECVPPFQLPSVPIGPLQPTSPITPQRPQPAPGECLSTQQVVSAQPCFYLVGFGEDPSGWSYQGPPELIAGANPDDVARFCINTGYTDLIGNTGDGYFVLPLCDPERDLPRPPSCITPEQRRILTYCAERGSRGGDPAANYFCWFALKAPAMLREWVDTPDCPPGQVPIPPPLPPPGTPTLPSPPVQTPTTAKSSIAVPLLIGAAIVGGAALLLS